VVLLRVAAIVLALAGVPSPARGQDAVVSDSLARDVGNRSLETDSLAESMTRGDSLAADSLAGFRNRSLEEDSLAASGVRGDSLAVVGVRGDSLAGSGVRRDSVVAFPPPRVRAWQVGLARGDRLEHASLSFAIASAMIIATRDRTAGAATAFAMGLGKEIWDGRRGHFDPVDLAADAVGVMLATVLVAPRGP